MGLQVQQLAAGESGAFSHDNVQFINFSWGGRNIVDFNLIATFGDMYSKALYTTFTDTTTKITGLPGQIYWGSNYEPLKISFSLATDGMAAKELNDFINYFKPEIERELVLSETPYRGINARLSATPTMKVVPFQKKVVIRETEEVLINEYKGTIDLTFVADFPFWHSKYIGTYYWANIKEGEDDNYNSKRQAVIEDNLFVVDFIDNEDSFNYCFLSNNMVFTSYPVDDTTTKKGVLSLKKCKATLLSDDSPDGYEGVTVNEDGLSLTEFKTKTSYLYNCGTHEAYPVLSFSVNIFGRKGGSKISFNPIPGSGATLEDFPTLKIGEESFSFKLPLFFEDFNLAYDILSEENQEPIEKKNKIRDKIKHAKVRELAYKSINNGDKSPFLKVSFSPTIWYQFDSKNKTAKVIYSIFIENSEEVTSESKITENAEDTIYNSYLTLKERTTFSDNYTIPASNLLKITTNCQLNSFEIDYDYLYK